MKKIILALLLISITCHAQKKFTKTMLISGTATITTGFYFNKKSVWLIGVVMILSPLATEKINFTSNSIRINFNACNYKAYKDD